MTKKNQMGFYITSSSKKEGGFLQKPLSPFLFSSVSYFFPTNLRATRLEPSSLSCPKLLTALVFLLVLCHTELDPYWEEGAKSTGKVITLLKLKFALGLSNRQ